MNATEWMRGRRAALAPLATVLLLAGCGTAYDYTSLKTLDPAGEDFDAALGREYKAFALFEADEMRDWPDAAHFGKKADRAARGARPAPEHPDDWRLPAAHLGEIVAARARLLSALDGAGARLDHPATAARAQASFDCWVEQREENWQEAHIARCRDGFMSAMAELEKAPRAPGNAAIPLLPARAAPAPEVGAEADTPPRAFTLFFAFDQAGLPGNDGDPLDAIASAAKAGRSILISIAGHADRAGRPAYNEALSLARAESVRRELLQRGVPAERIKVGAHGESRPRVLTPDGVREPRNRRVEVIVGPASAL